MAKKVVGKKVVGRKEHWKADPEEHDFPAALDYLSLLVVSAEAEALVASLRSAPSVHRKAKDLLRASCLDRLDETNPHVAKDLRRVRRGGKLSPVLLVRGDLGSNLALTVADGYHRICASYLVDEDAEIPCRFAELRGVRRTRSARPTAPAGPGGPS